MQKFLLLICHLLGLCGSGYGIHEMINIGQTSTSLKYLGSIYYVFGLPFFILSILSNICGLISLAIQWSASFDPLTHRHQRWLQYHFLFAWLTSIVGYPAYVHLIWSCHYSPIFPIIFHIGLIVYPLLMWTGSSSPTAIDFPTQLTIALTVLSHLYINALAYGFKGLVGMTCGTVMLLNVIFLTLPMKNKLLGFSSREGYLIGMALASVLFAMEVGFTSNNAAKVEALGNPLKF